MASEDCQEVMQCPQGCFSILYTETLENHLRNDCESRYVICTFCLKSYVVKNQQVHESECPMFPVSCPHRCGLEGMARNLMKLHIQDCYIKEMPCKYIHLGCEYKGRDKKLASHEDDVKLHFEMVASLYMNLHLRFDIFYQCTRALILELQNNCLILKTSLDDTKKDLQRLKSSKKSTQEMSVILDIPAPANSNSNYDKTIEELNRNITVLSSRVEALQTSASKPTYGVGPPSEAWSVVDPDIELWRKHESQNTVASCNGVLQWRIRNYRRLKRDATYKCDKPRSMYSKAFYSSKHGYRMCAVMYINGRYSGEGTHVSLYLVIMKGPHDSFLTWPFNHTIKFTLVDTQYGTHNVDRVVRQDAMDKGFRKPFSATNPPVGFETFVAHELLEQNDLYLHEDSLHVRITVGTPSTNEA